MSWGRRCGHAGAKWIWAGLVSVGAAALVPLPAQATTTGGVAGGLVGSATLSPGIPTSGCVSSSYTALVTAALGRGLVDSPPSLHLSAGVDELALELTGAGTECPAQGSGTSAATCSTVGSLGADADASGVDDVAAPAPVTCALAGTTTRVGDVVLFDLHGTISASDPSAGGDPSEPPTRVTAVELTVAASYQPTGVAPCGSAQCVNQALITGTAAGSVVVPPGPATTRVAAGGVVFKGTGELSTFPCGPPPTGTGGCSGAFSGDSTGELSGVSGGSAYAVTWLAPMGSINASFTYSELDCTGLETLVGFASGTGSAYAGPGEVEGKWQVPGETFPRDITAASGTFTFRWARAGTVAALTLDSITVTLEVSGLGTQTVITQPQSGFAAFAATQTDPINGPPLCATPLTNVRGDIAGSLSLSQASA